MVSGAAALCYARRAGLWRLCEDDVRPRQLQIANNGQRRFHVTNIELFRRFRQTVLGQCLPILGLLRFIFVRRLDFAHVLGGVFVEVLLAIFAAEFHFASLVFENEGFAHITTELVAGHRARGELIRNRCSLLVIGRRSDCSQCEKCRADKYEFPETGQ